MYLKSLELHGFKSFPEKTVIEFDSGSTVIVGPNGSGKSNITDAMRWVLGELSSKNIRGSKMEDVIFVGADSYRQMNFAEVSVTFDDSEKPKRLNSEYDEITVTRRYYRTGDSEYFINRKSVRLKDIYELFMNTGIGRDGYSIIGQGKIAEIISKKSEERRSVFEETAGISKYRYRKHESERKLQETESNMVRIYDILSELESRIGPMQRSAQKARRYIELFEKKKEADVSLWLYDMTKKNEDIAKLEADLQVSRHELDIAEDTLIQLTAQSDRIFEESQQNKQEQSVVYEEIKALREEIHTVEKEYQILENNITHEKNNITNEESFAARDRENAENEKSRLSELERSLSEVSLERERAENELVSFRAHLDELSNKNSSIREKIQELFETIKDLSDKRSDITVRLEVLENVISQQNERYKTIDSDIEKYSKELAEKNNDLESSRKSVYDYTQEIDKLAEEILSLDKQINNNRDNAERIKRENDQNISQKSAVESRIAALTRMIEHFDGYNNSVKYVMNEADNGTLKGIHKPISYVIETSEEYTTAVETSLGAALQGIIVEDERDAKNAIRALKNANAGRATFYPISSVKKRSASKELDVCRSEKGFIGFANDLVKCDGIYDGIISYLLGNIAVFENIDFASDAAKKCGYSVRMVTLDGQQINPGGSFTGGSSRHDNGVISRKNTVEKLKTELSDIEKTLSGLEKKRVELNNELESLNNKRADVDERSKMLEALRKTEMIDMEEISARCDVLSGFINQLQADVDNISKIEKDGASDVESLNAESDALLKTIEELTETRNSLDSDSHDIEKEIEAGNVRMTELLIKEAELKKDVENAEATISEVKERISALDISAASHDVAVESIKKSIEQAIIVIESKRETVSQKQEMLENKEKEYGELEHGGLDFEQRLNEINRRSREISSKKELVLEAHTKGENKLQNLKDEIEKTAVRIFDEYELTHADAMKLEYPAVTKENRGEISRVLNESKNAIKALGAVNVDAIREYAELKERYDEIKTQYDDLVSSKDELTSLIRSISSEMEVIFKDAFEKINKNFGEVFRELFGGGNAELSLTDPDDVLNSGIEISAAPPGKIIKNLSLLSGGEQAFVAIALMFALIKVNPSPFCIFDEIEAALDEVNVGRVANYVNRFSKDIQIIMITHRRGTMEIADTLYGVTMPRHGVSKVFTLDISSVSKQKFAEENL